MIVFAICALDELVNPASPTSTGQPLGGNFPLAEGPLNPHEEAWGEPPRHRQRSESLGFVREKVH